ncbi:ADAMTS-like protein 5 isoform X2 [Scleropages formosus]|uniref:ADAMTS-like protein 5 isoform X2 n=1 Tax=Scleropages formosus TaxID=113540 RepID=UPI0010FAC397|nr:ADAMTS-like protein 5 isoform X2 [Scleropages formosus]XP_018620495.2 ADAMTS-like protein 5 isoform X2 [Scleropages formosus]
MSHASQRLPHWLVLIFVSLLASSVCPSPQHKRWLHSGTQASHLAIQNEEGQFDAQRGRPFFSPFPSSPLANCPTRIRRMLNLETVWGTWGGWSVCSRTCGGGASVRSRTCITRSSVVTPCIGEPRQYKACNTMECPPGSVVFRELQCAAFNDRPLVAGVRYRWSTFHGGSSPCELSCLALGQNFYYNFGHVLDGTPCQEPGSMCVNGRCLKPGCDSILGSEKQNDICMVCGGQNTTCLRHHSMYHNSNQGTALQNRYSQFVINGHWRISRPGEYSVAGTKLLYRRSADTFENFEVLGPTQENLRVMVLSIDKDLGIEYEYWLPLELYALYHGRKSQLHQPHTATHFSPWPSPATTSVTSTSTPPAAKNLGFATAKPRSVVPGSWSSRPVQQSYLKKVEIQRNELPLSIRPGHCDQCRRVRAQRNRRKQYCVKHFVFRGKVLGKAYLGKETRYDVQVMHTYRSQFRLERREFLWVPNVCDCPLLEEGRQYLIMARRHVNHEHAVNRILLDPDSYAQPYHHREDRLLRLLEVHCRNSRL